MVRHGKKVEIFLPNGDGNEACTIDVGGWSGYAVRISREEVENCSLNGLHGEYVYILLAEDNHGCDALSISCADNLKAELMGLITENQFYWRTAIAFGGHDLNTTFINYLSRRLNSMANEAHRYNVLSTPPPSVHVSQGDKAMLEEFIDNIRMVLAVLGYDIFKRNIIQPREYLFCTSRNGVYAKGHYSSKGFTVCAESKTSVSVSNAFEKERSAYYKQRIQLEECGIISNHVFTSDFEFRSPSAAASVVLGRSANGRTEWSAMPNRLSEIKLFCRYRDANAFGYWMPGNKIVVKAGSKLTPLAPTPSCPSKPKEDMIRYRHIIRDGILQEDITFSSPSEASSFVTQASTNGNDQWRDENGASLKELKVRYSTE
ncbi:MAG: DUF4357 domain-containing protein [Christensenellales bacterium]